MSTAEIDRSEGLGIVAGHLDGTSAAAQSLDDATANDRPPPASEVDADVGLPRLLELSRITPGQALGIALDVLSAVEARHGAGQAYGGFGLAAVRVGIDGRTRLSRPLAGSGPTPELQESDLAGAGSLLAALVRAARQSSRPTDQRAQTVVAALDRAAAAAPGGQAAAPDGPVAMPDGQATPSDGPVKIPEGQAAISDGQVAMPDEQAAMSDEQVAAVAAMLRCADAMSGTVPAARAELAGLVAAAIGRPCPARGAALPRPVPRRPPETRRAPWRSGVRGVGSTLAKRTWKWMLSLAILAAIIALEFALLGDHITRDIEVLLNTGRTEPTAAAPTMPLAPTVPAPAPTAAGPVDAVDLRALGPCTPGEVCEVRLLVRLQPQAEPQTVDWTFRVLDRCTGAEVNAPGGVLSVLPDGADVSAVDTVSLPASRALAVFALTGRPGTAASPPLLVPAPGYCEAGPSPGPG
ncbi:hypothetical protein [Pseudonocardia sp. H11422]|uniref:hypothetical protein n=1 Tax=Pseudonocardia sp. H11422 TaxID=2835866 RepID=UPI001BDDAB8E|nr:hypothetical protein [Pseudonocardia sp. H11422]